MNIIKQLLQKITELRIKLILQKCNEYLGIDFTPNDVIPDEVGCAEAVTTLLKNIGIMGRVIPGTWTLNEYLKADAHWIQVFNPEPGDIIISPTGTSSRRGAFPGHVGIVGPNAIIYSNDSYTGKWMTHYTLTSWKNRYASRGGYPVLFYRYNYTL